MSDKPCARILYIDDDSGLARLVARSLERAGYAVEHAGSGAEGLARLKQGGIDIVALDHFMPGETGLEVVAKIRALPEPPPILYVTGTDDSRVAVAALKAGAVDYVWKDVDGQFRELLVEAVATALEREKLRREKAEAERQVRAARDKAEMLLREVNHRVANSLAIVSALVRMQSSAVSDVIAKAALETTQARISAIAGLHRRLYTSDDVSVVDLDAYLAGLVGDIKGTMTAAGQGHPVKLSTEAIRVPTDKAVSVGIVAIELITNAYKYAYREGTSGEIRISLTKQADNKISLVVEDDGIGWDGTGKPQGTGLGSRVADAMADNLHTKLMFDEAHKGTRISLIFPI